MLFHVETMKASRDHHRSRQLRLTQAERAVQAKEKQATALALLANTPAARSKSKSKHDRHALVPNDLHEALSLLASRPVLVVDQPRQPIAKEAVSREVALDELPRKPLRRSEYCDDQER